MERMTGTIEKRIAPVANKLARQKYIQVMQSTFLSLIPFFTLGSFALIIVSPPVDPQRLDPGFGRSFFQGWTSLADFAGPAVLPIYFVTIGAISLYVVAGMAFYLGRHHKMQSIVPVATALAAFLIMAGTDEKNELTTAYLGGTGLFTGIIVTIGGFELYRFLYAKRVGRIELSGNGVPPALTESLASLVPIVIVLLTAGIVSALTRVLTGSPFPDLIRLILTPLVSGVNTIWVVILLAVVVMLLWWFGIHDTVITGPLSPFLINNMTANAAAYAAGATTLALPFIVSEPFWWTFMAIGGSGATMGLAFLAAFSKSKHIKTVGRLSVVPALFNINEPLIFGLPLMYNPVLFFPFIGTMAFNGAVAFVFMDLHLIGRPFVDPGWNMIAPVGALISTLDWKAMLLVLGLIVVDALIYLPFFKVYEKQKLAEERAQADSDAEAVAASPTTTPAASPVTDNRLADGDAAAQPI
ncbi:PTS sugar transporter subunit IIC [Schumannella luteola]|nr:PTS sugar transporter subunit IIC [Schumannella luteola]